MNSISTRFADRDASVEPIARVIAEQYEQQPGNYLAFFSSFDYLERATAAFGITFHRIRIGRKPGVSSRASERAFSTGSPLMALASVLQC